jgi:GPN-loop GTPase
MTQLVVVHLSDCFCLTQPSLYISNILLALRGMLQMDLPHVNVLTKIDKISEYDTLPFNLDFYTEVQDLSYLMPSLEEESPALRSGKFSRLNQAIANLVEQFGLVSFEVLMHLLRVIDRAGGYAFGSAEGANDTIWQVAMRNEASIMDVQDIQERWIDNKEAYDEAERKEEEEQERIRMAQAEAAAEAGGMGGMGSMPQPVPDSGIRVVRKKN